MNIHDLSSGEKLALAALVRALIAADGNFSAAESDRLNLISKQLGDSDGFFAAITEAEQKVTTPEELKAVTVSVTRPEVRQLILDVLEGLGAAETAIAPDAQMLSELRGIWGMPESGAPAVVENG